MPQYDYDATMNLSGGNTPPTVYEIRLDVSGKKLAIELNPMSDAPKDGTFVLCLVRHDYAKRFDGNNGRLTPYGAWAECRPRVRDGVCVLSYGGGYSETDRESGVTERMPDWWFDIEDRVGYPVGWFGLMPDGFRRVNGETYPSSV